MLLHKLKITLLSGLEGLISPWDVICIMYSDIRKAIPVEAEYEIVEEEDNEVN